MYGVGEWERVVVYLAVRFFPFEAECSEKGIFTNREII